MATPYSFIKQGPANLFVTPVGPVIAEVPYPTQSFTKPPDFSLWVHGQIQEPGLHLDRARMAPRLYQEVRDDVTRFSPVEVTRSAFRRSQYAYVGVIDSRGTPYYFALDSRGVSVSEADVNDDRVWKTFERLATDEHMAGVRQRRSDSVGEMQVIDRELSEPLVVTKGIKYGKKADWKRDTPRSAWWRRLPKTKKPPGEDGDQEDTAKADDAGHIGRAYAAAMRRVGSEIVEQVGEEDLDPPRPEDEEAFKALPRKAKEDGVKKTPTGKASKKQAGAGGKTRYTYPQERTKGPQTPRPQVPLVVVHDDTKHADPAELANQLGVSVRTLQRCARRLGSDGFTKFMRSHLKRFATKHRLDPDYWGTLYATLLAPTDDPIAKSDDDGGAEFGRHVNAVASAVPKDHPERFFGSHKVFIHHVHHEMKRRGLYSGGLDEFKDKLLSAHKNSHVEMSRADLVSAMNPRSVAQSEVAGHHGASGATFHFVNAEHDPDAAAKLDNKNNKTSAKQGSAAKTHDPASTASQWANDATIHAKKVGTPEAHLAAMSAHHQAGVAHQKATGKINNKTALRHFDQSMSHLASSKAKM